MLQQKSQFQAWPSWVWSFVKERRRARWGNHNRWDMETEGLWEGASSGKVSEGRIGRQTDVRNMREAQTSEDEAIPWEICPDWEERTKPREGVSSSSKNVVFYICCKPGQYANECNLKVLGYVIYYPKLLILYWARKTYCNSTIVKQSTEYGISYTR